MSAEFASDTSAVAVTVPPVRSTRDAVPPPWRSVMSTSGATLVSTISTVCEARAPRTALVAPDSCTITVSAGSFTPSRTASKLIVPARPCVIVTSPATRSWSSGDVAVPATVYVSRTG